ncbi:MAG: recombination protein RecR [Chitinophagaceae bacterium]|jgi:recombination protein RecR|nr:recombination protein RecR [Chitinophagaceae bacterium]MCA6468739.1 recombination protein RecR [Chitinophagaceae bacterium]MCA6469229.1 recombination protein RecR [Chitinophagaceae bacterium]MCA6474132.1 recombination protein RecR [Chitinophagaceae bacterium]MCA6474472.1 recombination protein RecR [Chitinophagaceae bacterium]
MPLPSQLLENAVAAFAKLPGIGRKTALRLVLHLLKQEEETVTHFSETIAKLRREIQFCSRCHNISDGSLCSICTQQSRNQRLICVVESIRDVISIENTSQMNGTYHVLGGIISPLDGVGPEQLNITGLLSRIEEEQVEELIFALNPNIQGDTTIYYIQKKIAHLPCKITTIARGISFGGELEFADEMTLARSIAHRLPVQQYVK